jgi:hypothetical protein
VPSSLSWSSILDFYPPQEESLVVTLFFNVA